MDDIDVELARESIPGSKISPIVYGKTHRPVAGAKQVGIIQSLIATCRLHSIDVYTYLVDGLRRVSNHPAKNRLDLTPRVWKTKFANPSVRSDIARVDQ